MPRTITTEEMASRQRMSRAKCAITDAMGKFIESEPDSEGLTAVEWVRVLHECSERMIGHALVEVWSEQEQKAVIEQKKTVCECRCAKCGGSGSVEFTRDSWGDCPACNGKGR